MELLITMFCAIITISILPTCIGQGEETANTVTITDLAGRTVTIDRPIESVVITFNFEEYLAAEGGEEPFQRIIGWTRAYWDGRRQWTWEKYSEAFPGIEEIPDVGYIQKGSFSAETVISLNPDVVIMAVIDYGAAKDDVSRLEQAGIPVICVNYHLETQEAHTKSTLVLGQVLDREERAQELVEFYEEQIGEVTSRLKDANETKPVVYIEVGFNGPSEYSNTYGKDFMWGALIEQCNGVNIAGDVVEKSGPINPEYLINGNPDMIVITGSYWPSNPDSMRLGYYADADESRTILKEFSERPGWNTFNAVKNEKVYSVHHALSRHIYDFVAMQYLAKCFYPQEFEDLDPEENFRTFHERFLPIDYSGVWTLGIED